MESIEKKYKELVSEGEVEKAKDMVRNRFEESMKKIQAENIVGKEGYVFICSGRNEGDEDFDPLVEFPTADEARNWYESDGKAIIEDGGEIKIDYGPKKLED